MLLGLISDTHGHRDLVEESARFFSEQGVTRVVHTGDVTQVKHIDSLLELDVPLHLAFGNCDFNTTGFEQAQAHTSLNCVGSKGTLSLHGKTLAFTHGHFDRSIRELLAGEPDYLIHGHTHERRDETHEGTRIINPGAIKPPNSSFAILNLVEDELNFESLEVKTDTP